ncbi:non-heme iron oxygenase ferredoxin subunit [Bradyrhizobium symbiodeficiens]|uniref:Non-heme iron oxygenase ferredoxin subunit n=1 Tax=Bradyrhizobium symbiodeficiens TaxID=1404367 RepID=A0ABX5W8P1_9BRAD|nr:non-heme iron oxygenase ferredoxin subunit [Bradyrhizobium symbiodeficiens]QDF38807.1 non-heme iron oxygenase ferredoxin subunit [Bradyrhizobium symbiodeficiens]
MEAQFETQGGRWVKVAELGDLPKGSMTCIAPDDIPIAIYHLDDGSLWATEAVCSHQYALLTDGILEDDLVECPLHGAQFNVKTGKALSEPAEIDLRTYEVRLDGMDILLKI